MSIAHDQREHAPITDGHDGWRKFGLTFVFIWFFVGGIGHFVLAHAFISIVPPYVPFPSFWVWFTGVCELAGAIGILMPRFRSAAGIGLIVLSVCVTPANLEMALHAERYIIGAPALWARLAFQPVLLWIIWRSTRRA